MGRLVALLLKQNRLIMDLRIHCKGKNYCGTAIDLAQIDTTPQVTAFMGMNSLREAMIDSHIVVVCGKGPEKPDETEEELFDKNVAEVRMAATFASEFCPEAIFCIGCPPVNALVPMVSEEYKKARVYDRRKIIGITNLVTSRANSLIACYSGRDASSISCPVIGGACPYSAVCLFSQTKPKFDWKSGLPGLVQEKLQIADNDILELKMQEGRKGDCYLSNAYAVSKFVNNLVRAVDGWGTPTEIAFVRQPDEIAYFLPYMMSPVTLGRKGIQAVHMPKLSGLECDALQKAAVVVQHSINLGTWYVTGDEAKKPARIPRSSWYCPKPVPQIPYQFVPGPDYIPDNPCPKDRIRAEQRKKGVFEEEKKKAVKTC